jgi:pilus assembly protein Flp/PilA
MIRRTLRKFLKNNKGAALVEYGLLIAGVALICAAAVSIFGHKTSDIIGTVAAVLPGAHTDDNNPMLSGHLIETATSTGADGATGIGIDFATIASSGTGGGIGTDRLGVNIGGTASSANGVDGLIVEAH